MKLSQRISLVFNGQCEAAFKLYAQCLNGTIAFSMGSDLPPSQYERPQGFSIVLQMDDPVMAERAFNALAADGRIHMPLQETFWASRFGVLVHPFGISWSINCERPAEPI